MQHNPPTPCQAAIDERYRNILTRCCLITYKYDNHVVTYTAEVTIFFC